jgi:DNA-binding NarL/FixJ family response regulator
MQIRILIADDDPSIRYLLVRLIELNPEWHVCGEAVDGADAVLKMQELVPDLAILDLGMPKMNGLQAAHEILKTCPASSLLLLTVHEISSDLARAAQKIGFQGAVSKNNGREVLMGVEALLRRDTFFRLEESETAH